MIYRLGGLTSMKSFLWLEACRTAGRLWPDIWSQFCQTKLEQLQTSSKTGIDKRQCSFKPKTYAFIYGRKGNEPFCHEVSSPGWFPLDDKTIWHGPPCCFPRTPTCSGCVRWREGWVVQQTGTRRSRRYKSFPSHALWLCKKASLLFLSFLVSVKHSRK